MVPNPFSQLARFQARHLHRCKSAHPATYLIQPAGLQRCPAHHLGQLLASPQHPNKHPEHHHKRHNLVTNKAAADTTW